MEDTLKNYQIPEIENKIEVLQKWVREIKNWGIYWKTESECEQAFNQDIFQNVLDYTKYPELQYTIEPKWSTEVSGQKPDAILGNFNANQQKDNTKNVQAVVEIKDANTSLDAPQKREWHLSPVQQGFKYKPQYEKCVWVIVTNFKEIRLYKDNQITGQSRNLVDLVNPEKDYLNLKFFYYILNAKNFLATPWEKESKTLKSLSEVKNYQKEITNKFYKEYKNLRLTLISDLHKRNSDKEIDFIIQKAQKIIDRIIFIHFCEDLGLLPEWWLENQLKAVWNIAGLTKWDALIWFFKAVDRWSDQLHIPQWYNWWLFKPDSDLDSLLVWDEICEDLVLFWDYDYGEDLTVNILWHIFEQSISDLEKIKLDMLWTKLETEDYGEAEWVSKRKKDWIFYTPEYIVDYIVRNSLWKYLEEKYHKIEKEALKWLKKDAGGKAIQQRDNKIYTEYKKVLENIKVCDPACGSGAFLVKVFDYLLSEHQRVANLLQQDSLFDQNEIYKDILQKNIYWVDLNPESVEITKLSLWLKTANKGKKLTNLDANIKCGNSLIDDSGVAGEKAFNRQEQFPEVFENGGFDVVVGNPPYVDSESMVKNIPEEREYIAKKFKTTKWNWDLLIPFIELAINLLKEKWKMSFITSNKWLALDYWNSVRNLIVERLNTIVDCTNVSVFESANVSSIIFGANKWKSNWVSVWEIEGDNIQISQKNFNIEGYNELLKNNLSLIFSQWISFIKKLSSYQKVKDIPGLNVFWSFTTWEAYDIVDIIKDKSWVWDQYFKMINTWTIDKYCPLWWFLPMKYLKNEYQFPVVEKNDLKELFENRFRKLNCSKIITTWIRYFECILDKNNEYLPWKSTITISWDLNILYQLIIVLNSKLINYYIRANYYSSSMWWWINFTPDLIKDLPFIISKDSKPFIEKADFMLNLNKEFHDELSQTFDFLSQKFWLQKITTKLEKFWELDFSVFKKELKIWKVSMMEEEDLMKRFENKKKYFESKLAEIDSVDNSIDEMVFDLYGLTKEEREIVRGK